MGPAITRRRLLQLAAAGSVVGGLGSCSAANHSEPSRPLKEAELNRLAAMRMHNFGDGRVGIRGTVGPAGRQTAINGWVDWRRSLIYMSVHYPAQDSVALVQAKPGVLAVRPAAKQAPGKPPPQPPADGWRIRPVKLVTEEGKEPEPDKAALDNLVAFLFLIARDQPDRADLLGKLNTEWVRRDVAQGAEVDVLLGPAVIPEREASPSPAPSGLDTHGGAVGYWLDANGRLRKVETLLGANMPTNLELIRDDRQEFLAIDALGGRDIEPREVTDAEAELLSLMRQRNYHARSAQVKVTLPALPGTLRTADGWLDWQRAISYLSMRDLDDAEKDALIYANGTGVSLRKPDGRTPGAPPLPAPKGGWERSTWEELELTDFDIILFEVLSAAFNQRDDVKRIKSMARRLRVDVLNGVPMGVFELPNNVEQQWAPGSARVRYWLDNSGVLGRLEVRTQTGGFAQLDLALGATVPALPASVH